MSEKRENIFGSDQLRYVAVIRAEALGIEERVEGYQQALNGALTSVLRDEQAHREKRTSIQQNVERQVQLLGQFLLDNQDPSPEGTRPR